LVAGRLSLVAARLSERNPKQATTSQRPATSNQQPDMLICRVVGDVVSTIKNHHLKGHKLLLVQPVDLDGQTPKGETMIALDKVDAGPQDLVLVTREGGAARILLGNPKIPVQAVIVGVIDNIDVA
jgi:microcompartment protein CcmK/EutM